MSQEKKDKGLHPRNPHNANYDFEALTQSQPDLKAFIKTNQFGTMTIDFADAKAVLMLNKALLSHFYDLKNWEIPKNYLTPPIPGRADYIHYMADLISNEGEIPTGDRVKVLDIGSGANCIYPIIGTSAYDWNFVATDIDQTAIDSINATIAANERLQGKIEARLQRNEANIFDSMIKADDTFTFTMCNPPFHKSRREATKGTHRKLKNLTKEKQKEATLNFNGQAHELWCKGGEIAFITTMIKQSSAYAQQVTWFSTLVSKKENLAVIKKVLKQVKAKKVEVIEMKQGNKVSRIVAWSFES
jgi:23S rRNA (adenine1618-N6)-methyltransferase